MTQTMELSLSDAEKLKILSQEIKAFEETLEALKMRLDVVAAVLLAALEPNDEDGTETLVQAALELLDIVQAKYFDPRYDAPESDRLDPGSMELCDACSSGDDA